MDLSELPTTPNLPYLPPGTFASRSSSPTVAMAPIPPTTSSRLLSPARSSTRTSSFSSSSKPPASRSDSRPPSTPPYFSPNPPQSPPPPRSLASSISLGSRSASNSSRRPRPAFASSRTRTSVVASGRTSSTTGPSSLPLVWEREEGGPTSSGALRWIVLLRRPSPLAAPRSLALAEVSRLPPR